MSEQRSFRKKKTCTFATRRLQLEYTTICTRIYEPGMYRIHTALQQTENHGAELKQMCLGGLSYHSTPWYYPTLHEQPNKQGQGVLTAPQPHPRPTQPVLRLKKGIHVMRVQWMKKYHNQGKQKLSTPILPPIPTQPNPLPPPVSAARVLTDTSM